MTLRQKLKSPQKNHGSWLFSVVFTSKVSITAVLLLLVSFCIQPFHQAMAAEEGATSEETETVPNDVAESEVEESGSAPDTVLEENTNTTDTTETTEEVTDSVDETTTLEETPTEEEIISENIEEVTEETATGTEDVVDESASTTDSGSGGDNEESSDDDTSTSTPDGDVTDESEDDTVAEDSETESEVVEEVTESVPEAVVEVQNIVTDENFYQFSKKSCVPVGDGTYHCTSKESSLYDASSAVYADRGATGNMEIFLRTSTGRVEQITDNNYDDTAPHYDAESKQIVWQRLVTGRYQVVLYSIESGEEKQLTFSKTNNMEPKVSEAGIVWQAWDNNDWEIMFFDGEFTEQITDNILQDVTPVIQDGYIVWSIIGGEEQEAKVYSLDSGETLTISGYEGGTIANPRFVLVYDTKFENGDVVTQGFNPETGLSKPISAQPAQDPVELPHNDPTGEIRALIQKSADDEDLGLEQTNTDGNNGSSTTLDLGGAKIVKDTSTLDLSGASTSSEIIFDVPSTTLKQLELTDFDLVITGSSSDDSDDE